MPVQSSFGRIGFFEDFIGIGATASIADATAGTRFNDIGLSAISGQTEIDWTVDEPNGIVSFTGAGGAGDGIGLYSAPMQPSTCGTIWMEARHKTSVITDYRVFAGFISTYNQAEPVVPFTLSSTTLTANNSGEAAGLYFDAQATTDDYRMLSSTAGVADLSASVTDAKGNATTYGTLGIRANCTVAVDCYTIVRVEMDTDGTVRCYVGDESMQNPKGLNLVGTLKAGTMTTTSLYFPVLLLTCHSTGDPLYEIDYFAGGGHRDWTI